MDGKPPERHMLPVWFFTGIVLAIYGVLILVSGIYEFNHPPATVLANLHPEIWWGAIMIAAGTVFIYTSAPRKSSGRD